MRAAGAVGARQVASYGLLVQGFVIGFAIAAPVGPIGVLCIRRTLERGLLIGLVSGLGAATADACYGLIAALGLSTISNWLLDAQDWIRLVGGLFLLYLGVTIWRAKPAAQGAQAGRRSGLLGAYASTLALTLTNPTTILSFIAIFAGLGLAERGRDEAGAVLLVVGVFAGSAFWWLLLSSGVSLLRGRLRPGWFAWVNRISGALIFAFGVSALLSLSG
jgi:threonine/homoserine/homoserine lactone efflux protein